MLEAALNTFIEESKKDSDAALERYKAAADGLGFDVIAIVAAPPKGEIITSKQGRNFATEQGSGSDTVVKFYEGLCDQKVGEVYVPCKPEPKP